jgi:hypothetical protein
MADIEKNQDYTELPFNAYLIINSRIFPLDQEEITVGRDLENQLVINDPSISRWHARLVAVDSKFVVSDLNSTNGTLINGKLVDQQLLSSGDTLSFADVPTMYIEYSPDLLDKARDRTRYPMSEHDQKP